MTILVLVILTVLVLFTRQTLPRLPLPSPNGYDDLVKASQAVTGNVSYYRTLDHDSLRALVSTNAQSLRLLRVGLSRKCAPPRDAIRANMNLSQLADMSKMVRLLAAEGRLREMANRPGDAAQSYVDAIRFGNEMSQGGVLVTRLLGLASEAIGCQGLAQVVPRLSCEDAQHVLSELAKADTGRVTWAETGRNERYFARYQLGHWSKPLRWVMGWWQTRQAIGKAEIKYKAIMAQERLVAGELALRCFQAEQGHPPARLEVLVPNYLSQVPQDPFTRQPMVYRLQGTNWLLYSVGPDGVDDGGRPAGRGWPIQGDIRFDSAW